MLRHAAANSRCFLSLNFCNKVYSTQSTKKAVSVKKPYLMYMNDNRGKERRMRKKNKSFDVVYWKYSNDRRGKGRGFFDNIYMFDVYLFYRRSNRSELCSFRNDRRKTRVLTGVGLSPCSHNNTLVTSVPGCTAPLFRDKIEVTM